MSLARTYATVLKTAPLEKVLRYMKVKGHLSLLPQVARIMEREGAAKNTVTVATEADVKAAAKQFPDARVVVDPRVVGGYLARLGATVIDATYRKALVTIYKNATR